MTRVQIFRVSKREACSGGVVKRVPRSGVYDADPVVRLAFTYLGQVMARSRLFVYTKLDASHLATRRWFFEALATSATGWPCEGLSCVWRSTKGGVSPLVVGSSRSCAVMKVLCRRVVGRAAVLEQRLSSPLNGTTATMTAAPGLSDSHVGSALTSVVVVMLLRLLARVGGRQVDSCLNWFAAVGANRRPRIAKLAVHLSLIAYDVCNMSPSRSQRGELDREHGTRAVARWMEPFLFYAAA